MLNNLYQQPEITFIKIADGAEESWGFFSDTLFPGNGVELLDYFHACDPLNDAMDAAAKAMLQPLPNIRNTKVG